jgi:tetratricopeptide (TPR) repeat protein
MIWSKKARLLSANPDKADEALMCFCRAIELNPALGEAWIGKGVVLTLRFRKLEEAQECLQKAHELGEPDADALIKSLKSAHERGPTIRYTLQVPENRTRNELAEHSAVTLLQETDEQTALSLALVHLLQGRLLAREFVKAQAMAEKAIAIASQHPNSWVSKGIRCHAYAWFFYDPEAALAVFGEAEQAAQVLESNSIEKLFTTGIGSLCGRKYDSALEAFRAAGRFEQGNAFIDVCIAIVLIEQGAPDASSFVEHCGAGHKGHPLLSLIRFDRTA